MVIFCVAQEKEARTYNVSILAGKNMYNFGSLLAPWPIAWTKPIQCENDGRLSTLKEVVPVIPNIQAFENLLSFLFSQ